MQPSLPKGAIEPNKKGLTLPSGTVDVLERQRNALRESKEQELKQLAAELNLPIEKVRELLKKYPPYKLRAAYNALKKISEGKFKVKVIEYGLNNKIEIARIYYPLGDNDNYNYVAAYYHNGKISGTIAEVIRDMGYEHYLQMIVEYTEKAERNYAKTLIRRNDVETTVEENVETTVEEKFEEKGETSEAGQEEAAVSGETKKVIVGIKDEVYIKDSSKLSDMELVEAYNKGAKLNPLDVFGRMRLERLLTGKSEINPLSFNMAVKESSPSDYFKRSLEYQEQWSNEYSKITNEGLKSGDYLKAAYGFSSEMGLGFSKTITSLFQTGTSLIEESVKFNLFEQQKLMQGKVKNVDFTKYPTIQYYFMTPEGITETAAFASTFTPIAPLGFGFFGYKALTSESSFADKMVGVGLSVIGTAAHFKTRAKFKAAKELKREIKEMKLATEQRNLTLRDLEIKLTPEVVKFKEKGIEAEIRPLKSEGEVKPLTPEQAEKVKLANKTELNFRAQEIKTQTLTKGFEKGTDVIAGFTGKQKIMTYLDKKGSIFKKQTTMEGGVLIGGKNIEKLYGKETVYIPITKENEYVGFSKGKKAYIFEAKEVNSKKFNEALIKKILEKRGDKIYIKNIDPIKKVEIAKHRFLAEHPKVVVGATKITPTGKEVVGTSYNFGKMKGDIKITKGKIIPFNLWETIPLTNRALYLKLGAKPYLLLPKTMNPKAFMFDASKVKIIPVKGELPPLNKKLTRPFAPVEIQKPGKQTNTFNKTTTNKTTERNIGVKTAQKIDSDVVELEFTNNIVEESILSEIGKAEKNIINPIIPLDISVNKSKNIQKDISIQSNLSGVIERITKKQKEIEKTKQNKIKMLETNVGKVTSSIVSKSIIKAIETTKFYEEYRLPKLKKIEMSFEEEVPPPPPDYFYVGVKHPPPLLKTPSWLSTPPRDKKVKTKTFAPQKEKKTYQIMPDVSGIVLKYGRKGTLSGVGARGILYNPFKNKKKVKKSKKRWV